MTWIQFWAAFFVVSIALFAVLVVVVTVRGFDDLRRLLRDKARESKATASPPDQSRP